jgi:pimeloyl-ACP methyl ester carboxylesterase
MDHMLVEPYIPIKILSDFPVSFKPFSYYSFDMLGWGLSPQFQAKENNISPKCVKAFFVKGLEAWLQAQDIDKMMLLAGHSMGGYLSIVYCENDPEETSGPTPILH